MASGGRVMRRHSSIFKCQEEVLTLWTILISISLTATAAADINHVQNKLSRTPSNKNTIKI